MGDIQTTSGAKFYISDAATTAATDTLAEYEALSWIEVGLIEDLGRLGDVSTEVTGASIRDGRIRKAKGARNAGTQTVICFQDPFDAGQAKLREAQATNDNYAFKMEVPDGPADTFTNTFRYYRGLVMSEEGNYGTNDNIMRYTFNIGVNSAVTEEPAATV